jgi:hypothetical protein
LAHPVFWIIHWQKLVYVALTHNKFTYDVLCNNFPGPASVNTVIKVPSSRNLLEILTPNFSFFFTKLSCWKLNLFLVYLILTYSFQVSLPKVWNKSVAVFTAVRHLMSYVNNLCLTSVGITHERKLYEITCVERRATMTNWKDELVLYELSMALLPLKKSFMK